MALQHAALLRGQAQAVAKIPAAPAQRHAQTGLVIALRGALDLGILACLRLEIGMQLRIGGRGGLLGGEGPLAPTPTSAGKLFASFYALFSGLVFVTMAGLVLAPAIHRVMPRFHLEASEHDAAMVL